MWWKAGSRRANRHRLQCDWPGLDTGGRLFDPEYFYLEETNARLRHVLEDTPEPAEALFLKRGGLLGVLKPDWYQPVIEVGGRPYTWERLGKMLLMLQDDERPVTIKIGPNRWR